MLLSVPTRFLILGLFLILMVVFAKRGQSEDTVDSSACIACHTDLEEMDDYGAKAASVAAQVAG